MKKIIRLFLLFGALALIAANCQSKAEKIEGYLDDIKAIQKDSISAARLNWATNLTSAAAEQSMKGATEYEMKLQAYAPKIDEVIPEHAKLIGQAQEWSKIFGRLKQNPQDKAALDIIPKLEISEARWEASVRSLK